MNELISVIIPVYNIDKFLRKCIDSVLAQTYPNIEIILIDDGSTDLSGNICNEYAYKYDNITVFHQVNSGQSIARNRGVSLSKSNYITFVDGDDWIDSDFISVLYLEMKKANADLAVSRITETFKNRNNNYIDRGVKYFKTTTLDNKSALKTLLLKQMFSTSPCGKLFSKDILCRFPFPEGAIYEDFGIIYKIIDNSKRIVAIDKVGYHYFTREGSTVNSTFSNKDISLLNFSYQLVEYIRNKQPDLFDIAMVRFVDANIELLLKLISAPINTFELKRLYRTLYRNILLNAKYVLFCSECNLYIKFILILTTINPYLYLFYTKQKNIMKKSSIFELYLKRK